ncbi:unnamed protein product [Lathyrus sativus]|nr:unnamed protein product [Lathyrus sativus]
MGSMNNEDLSLL